MKIHKLLQALLLIEDDNERMDLPPKTFEDDPMNFILKKYSTLNEILVEIMGENYKEYLLGIYIIADKPTCLKIVLHNNQYFFMTFMGEAYQATISGKNYFLLNIGEKQRAMIAITRLLKWGSPLKTKGAEGAEQDTSADDMPTDETGSEEAGAGGGAEESGGGEEETLAEVKNVLSLLINESKLSELARGKYDILSPEAKKVVVKLISKVPEIKRSQIQPDRKNHIVVYNDNRADIIKAISDTGDFGRIMDKNSGDFITKEGNVTVKITIKPDKTSGEYYQLKPQNLGVDLNVFIPIRKLKLQLKAGIENHQRLNPSQKQFLLGMMGYVKPSQRVINFCLSNKKFRAEVNKNFGEPIGAIAYAEQINGIEILFPAAGNFALIDYRIKKARGPIVDVSAKAEGIKGNLVKLQDVLKKIKDKNLESEMTPDQKMIFDTVLDSEKGVNVAIKVLRLVDKFGTDKTKTAYKAFLKNNPGFLDKTKKDTEKYGKVGYDSKEMGKLQKDICRDINNNSELDFSNLFQQAVGVIYVKFAFDEETLEPRATPHPSEEISVYLDSKTSSGHVGESIGFQIKTS